MLVHPPEISDHSPITLTLPYYKPIAEKKTIAYRKLKDIDMDSFMKDLLTSQLCTNPQDDLDLLVDMYNDTLQNLLDGHAPLQTKQVTVSQQTKWYNEDIAMAKNPEEKQKRNGAQLKCKSTWIFTRRKREE